VASAPARQTTLFPALKGPSCSMDRRPVQTAHGVRPDEQRRPVARQAGRSRGVTVAGVFRRTRGKQDLVLLIDKHLRFHPGRSAVRRLIGRMFRRPFGYQHKRRLEMGGRVERITSTKGIWLLILTSVQGDSPLRCQADETLQRLSARAHCTHAPSAAGRPASSSTHSRAHI